MAAPGARPRSPDARPREAIGAKAMKNPVTRRNATTDRRSSLLPRAIALFLALAGGAGSARAQSPDFYAGKTLNVLVGVQAGGTVDTLVRMYAEPLRRRLAGSPAIIVQNMTGAGSNLVFNYFAEKAAPDGLTIVYSSYQALAQALGDPSLRARFENFEFLGGISDTRVGYARTDVAPGGLKTPADIVKAPNVVVGAYSNTDFEGTLSNLSLEVLGVKHQRVVGYRGGADIFLAMQRGEVQFHNTSIGSFRTRSAAFVKSGEGTGIYYLVSTAPDGTFEKNRFITEMPAFPDLYRQAYGKAPAGDKWDALNWLTAQTSELAYAAFAPRGTPPAILQALRAGFDDAARDPEFVARTVASNGIPYNFVNVERGREIVRSLASVSPGVLAALRATMGVQN